MILIKIQHVKFIGATPILIGHGNAREATFEFSLPGYTGRFRFMLVSSGCALAVVAKLESSCCIVASSKVDATRIIAETYL
jgi:hypothetical protein